MEIAGHISQPFTTMVVSAQYLKIFGLCQCLTHFEFATVEQ